MRAPPALIILSPFLNLAPSRASPVRMHSETPPRRCPIWSQSLNTFWERDSPWEHPGVRGHRRDSEDPDVLTRQSVPCLLRGIPITSTRVYLAPEKAWEARAPGATQAWASRGRGHRQYMMAKSSPSHQRPCQFKHLQCVHQLLLKWKDL